MTNKLQFVQLLRGIAALLVCCFHFRDRLNFGELKIGDFYSKWVVSVSQYSL